MPQPAPGIGLAILAGVAGLALWMTAPRGRVGAAALLWAGCVVLVGLGMGVAVGGARLAAIDAGALRPPIGEQVTVRGEIASFPRSSQGKVGVLVHTPVGRIWVVSGEPVGELDVGAGLEATGTIRAPPGWQASFYERLGVARLLAASEVRSLRRRRGGLAGGIDAIRRRSEAALVRGTPEGSANLLRGFVLGQDDRIDDATRERFKRSGLAHLLAVSGQNVVLLAILGAAVCALLGVSLRGRLFVVLALIALYVPLTGAGPSIQRAGVMGAAAIVAALASRPASRWYALLLAVAATLALNPRAGGDIGWQLSFAAVLGILLFCAPLACVLAGPQPGVTRRVVAEAAALTISATLATAPLTAFHFETLSLVSLPANLLALPAEAPVMWLGMLAAAVGQIPSLPVEPLTGLAGLLAAYIDQVAAWTAGPAWAQVDLGVGGALALACVYFVLATGLLCALRSAARRVGLRPLGRSVTARRRRSRWHLAIAGAASVALMLVVAVVGLPSEQGYPRGLRVDVLDVGQGDAILLRPPGAPAVLVDSGPPDADVASDLADLNVDELGALIITHPDLDHVGGASELLARVRAEAVLFARLDRTTRTAAEAVGADLERVAANAEVRSGQLRMDVLWPPRDRLGLGPPAEANELSVVLLVRWRGFRLLLRGDAEAEFAPVDPGEVDVLQVAHHGSEDAGLEALLARVEPELAVISVGDDNPYGHPTAATLATLDAAAVPVRRTDTDGTVSIAIRRSSWAVVEP